MKKLTLFDIDETLTVGIEKGLSVEDKIAIKKAEQNYGFEFDDNVFHTGDSPQDIKAGNEAGIKTIGVATGIYSKEQLKEAGADYVFDSLENTQKFLEIIGEESAFY